MDIARPTPAHTRSHTPPHLRPEAHDVAIEVVDALDRLGANGRRGEWNAFLLDIRQDATGEYLVRVGVFGPIQSELTIGARPLAGGNGVASTVTQAVAEWIAKYDARSPGRAVPRRAASGSYRH